MKAAVWERRVVKRAEEYVAKLAKEWSLPEKARRSCCLNSSHLKGHKAHARIIRSQNLHLLSFVWPLFTHGRLVGLSVPLLIVPLLGLWVDLDRLAEKPNRPCRILHLQLAGVALFVFAANCARFG